MKEDAEWLVVDKPPHLLIHPTRPDGADTLLGRLQRRYPNSFVAVINRLDRETSGLVLVARSSEAASVLGKQTMARTIKKRYEAIVFGVPPHSGEIDLPLDRLSKYGESAVHIKQGVVMEGYPAKTAFQVVETGEGEGGGTFSRLCLTPYTGRLHQLRVHLSHLGYPIVGDKIYGPDERCYLDFIEGGWTPALQEKLLMDRHALHANYLAFEWKGHKMEARSEEPGDMQDFWKRVRRRG